MYVHVLRGKKKGLCHNINHADVGVCVLFPCPVIDQEGWWFVHQCHVDTHQDQREVGSAHTTRVQYPSYL